MTIRQKIARFILRGLGWLFVGGSVLLAPVIFAIFLILEAARDEPEWRSVIDFYKDVFEIPEQLVEEVS